MRGKSKLLKDIYIRLCKSNLLHWDHLCVFLMSVVVALVLGFLSLNLTIFNPLQRAFEDFSMTDVYYEMQRSDEMELNSDIVLVDMTELRDRGEIGQAISDINACQPKVLTIDLIFQKEGEDPMGNATLMEAIDGCNNVVVSSKLVDYQPQKDSFNGLVSSFFSQFAHYPTAYGNVVQKQVGGTIRNYTIAQKLQGQPIYSLAYLSVCKYKDIQPKAQEPNQRLIVYGNTDFPVVNCRDIKRNAPLLKGKIVILGTLSDEEDSHVTPIGKMPGMKVQAYSMLSYLQNRHIAQMSLWTSILLAFILCYVSAYIGYRIIKWSPRFSIYFLNLYYFFVAALLVWASFLSFVHFHYNFNLLIPLLCLALVERGRLYYGGLVKFLLYKRHWKFLSTSLYA